MRTTLDLDPVVVSVAKVKARNEKISLGKAVSELVLASLEPHPAPQPHRGEWSFPTFETAAGHVITDDLVAAHRDEDMRDDAS